MLKAIALTLVAPLQLSFILLIIAAGFMLLRKRKLATVLCSMAGLWLLVWSQPYFSNLLLYPLEFGWTHKTPTSQVEIILVPGCYYNTEGNAAEISRWNHCALERYAEAVRQYKKHPVPVVVTGGNFLKDHNVSYSSKAKALLMSLGVPEKDIIDTGQGTNTRQEVKTSLPLLSGKHVMVISSATHYFRLNAYLSEYNIDFTYIPVDFNSNGILQPYLTLPANYALAAAHHAFYEYAAIIKYKWSL